MVAAGFGTAISTATIALSYLKDPLMQALNDIRDPSKVIVPIGTQLVQKAVQHPYIAAAAAGVATVGTVYVAGTIVTDPIGTCKKIAKFAIHHPTLATWIGFGAAAATMYCKNKPEFLGNVVKGLLIQASVLQLPRTP